MGVGVGARSCLALLELDPPQPIPVRLSARVLTPEFPEPSVLVAPVVALVVAPVVASVAVAEGVSSA